MFSLSNLFKLVKKRKVVGRGGSRGGTSGKGHKGQKARSGGSVSPAFEGGQMPLHRRLPKRGFNNYRFRRNVEIVSLNQLEEKFSDGDIVNRDVLIEKGLIKGKEGYVLKVLGGKTLSKKLNITADAFSSSAQSKITELGGEAALTKKG